MYPNVDQSLAAIRAAQSVAESFDRHLDAVNCNRLFDPSLNPRGYERIAAVVRQARLSNAAAVQAVPQVVFMAEPSTVHVVRDLREVGSTWRWLWGLRWTTGRCDIRDAAECRNASGTGETTYVTVSQPPTTVAIEICGACLAHLKEVAEGGEILAEIDATIAYDTAEQQAVTRWRNGGDR